MLTFLGRGRDVTAVDSHSEGAHVPSSVLECRLVLLLHNVGGAGSGRRHCPTHAFKVPEVFTPVLQEAAMKAGLAGDRRLLRVNAPHSKEVYDCGPAVDSIVVGRFDQKLAVQRLFPSLSS
jgi:hypothetical protein